MEFSPRVTDWLHDQLGVQVRRGTVLPGATTAQVVAFETGENRYVVKLFDKDFFVDEEPDRALHEATVLELLEPLGIPSPRLIGFDEDGSRCGVPAVLMTRLPGERGVGREHAAEMAEIAAALHTADVSVPWTFERYNHGLETRPPRWGRDHKLWAEVLELVESAPPVGEWGFVHRDYNSTNFLTEEGRITGVVDWLSACHGPFGIDAARLRLDLTFDGEIEVAEAVRDAFRRSEHDVVDPFWDLVDAVDLLPFYEGFEAVDTWGDPARRARLDAFVRDALKREIADRA